MLPGVLTLRAERGRRSLPVGGGGGAPFCVLTKPPKHMWLLKTHSYLMHKALNYSNDNDLLLLHSLQSKRL